MKWHFLFLRNLLNEKWPINLLLTSAPFSKQIINQFVPQFKNKMLRTPLTRTLSLGAPSRVFAVVRTSASAAATPAKVPEKIEVFVDDQSVFVDPGTTVLQVNV